MTQRTFAITLCVFLAGCSCGSSTNGPDGGTTGTGTGDGGTTATGDGGTGLGDGGTENDGGTLADAGTGTDGGTAAIPPKPTLGTQLDRMGRAAVNTALTDPFDTDATAQGQKKDAYNASSNRTQWPAQFSPEIAGNLAIYDALDAVCGNQIAAGPAAVPGRYTTLAALLADDELLLNTASSTCTQYLAVEENIAGMANTDCGGRTPLEDVIDVTYSLLATGQTTGVTDGVSSDADGNQSLSDFPFIGEPNP